MIKFDFSKEWKQNFAETKKLNLSLEIQSIGVSFRLEELRDSLVNKFELHFYCPEKPVRVDYFPDLETAKAWCEEQASARLEAVQKFIEDRRIK